MSEDEKIIDNFKYWFETNTENGVSTIPDFICKKLLDLCQREKDSNQWLLKAFDESRNNNIELAKEHYKLQEELKQEKEKNKNLIKQLQEQNTEIQDISKQLREKEQEDIKMRAKFVLSLDDYILKDKIRSKIEEVKRKREEEWKTAGISMLGSAIDVLIELLEEN